MTWGEFKSLVDKELAANQCGDEAQIDYIDVTSAIRRDPDVCVFKWLDERRAALSEFFVSS